MHTCGLSYIVHLKERNKLDLTTNWPMYTLELCPGLRMEQNGLNRTRCNEVLEAGHVGLVQIYKVHSPPEVLDGNGWGVYIYFYLHIFILSSNDQYTL